MWSLSLCQQHFVCQKPTVLIRAKYGLNNDALATMNVPRTMGGGYVGTLCTVLVIFLPTRNYSQIKTLFIKKKKKKQINKTKIKDHPNLSGAERTLTDESQS